MNEDEPIYLILRKENGRFIGHAITKARPTKDTLIDILSAPGTEQGSQPEPDHEQEKKSDRQPDAPSFSSTIGSFISIMSTYRNVIPFTLAVSPMLSGVLASAELGRFGQERGTEIKELGSDGTSVFEVPKAYFGNLIQKHENAKAALKGAEHLPEIAIIGLISVYDAYLAKLLKNIFLTREEIVFTSEREIKYSTLLGFSTIEQAKESLIEKEVESVIRNSHHDQFAWMENKFDMKLKNGLTVWPEFVELCERRNLLTHTGGIVSEQYIGNCAKHGHKSKFQVGDQLKTDAEYLKRAVQVVSEIGLKLGHVLWRKFKESEREKADSELNETALNLIRDRGYAVAEKLLDLGANHFKKHSSDEARRMMIVNLANATRLGGDQEGAKTILAKEDWSATAPNFRICVASVRGDIAELSKLLRAGGAAGPVTAEQYREWPVFRGTRREAEFCAAFLDTFGEPVFKDDKLKILPDESSDAPLKDDKTMH